jgi:serine/threonine protein kinase/DNA-binding winged helix-turn-helix (wHTH) protein
VQRASINPQFPKRATRYTGEVLRSQQVVHPLHFEKLAMKIDSLQRLGLGSFEVNLKTGEIRVANSPPEAKGTFLPEKALRILRMLMDRQGELVLREEIQKTLWPNDTVVDFDHGIHVAVATLRRALGDSAASPRYVETIPRRGYRLLVLVEQAGPVESPDPEAIGGDPHLADQGGLGLVGKLVSHFRVLAILGSGGMGTVYEAEDLKLGRRVALKVLPEEMADDPSALKRFEHEARTASSLNHRNICTIYAVEEFERKPVIVMELLRGETLRDRLARATEEPISLDELLDIALQTCDGLAAAHSSGIVHRDIKPANLFLITTDRTAARCVKIVDFGLAKLIAAESAEELHSIRSQPEDSWLDDHSAALADISATRSGGAAGTASYMSPEQIRRENLDPRTDLFSFGLVLYEMATGRRAFPGDDAAKVQQALLNDQPIPVRQMHPSIPAELETVIVKATERDRVARYQSAEDMRAALGTLKSPQRTKRRLTKWLLLAAIAIIVTVAIPAYWRYRTRFQLAANDAIVIADTTNQTIDTALTGAVNTALQVEFAHTPFFRVLAQNEVRQTMQSMGFAADAPVTPDVALEVCLKTNSNAVITSDIADEGNKFHIQLAAVNCRTGTVFAKIHGDAATRVQIIHEVGVVAVDLRHAIGEPNASIAKFSMPL